MMAAIFMIVGHAGMATVVARPFSGSFFFYFFISIGSIFALMMSVTVVVQTFRDYSRPVG